MERKLKAKVVVNKPPTNWEEKNYNGLKQFVRHQANSSGKVHYNRNVIVAPSNGKPRVPVIKKISKNRRKTKHSKIEQNTNDTKIPEEGKETKTKSDKLPETKEDTANKETRNKYSSNIWNNHSFHVHHCKTSDQQTQQTRPEEDMVIMNNEQRPHMSRTATFIVPSNNPISILKSRVRSADISENVSSNTAESNRLCSTSFPKTKEESYKELNRFGAFNQKQPSKQFGSNKSLLHKSEIAKKNLVIDDPFKISIPLYTTRVRESTPDTENTFGINTESLGSTEEPRSYHKTSGEPSQKRNSGHSSRTHFRKTNADHGLVSTRNAKQGESDSTSNDSRNVSPSRSRTPTIRSQLSKIKLNGRTSVLKKTSTFSTRGAPASRRRETIQEPSEGPSINSSRVNLSGKKFFSKIPSFGGKSQHENNEETSVSYKGTSPPIRIYKVGELKERMPSSKKEIESKSSSLISLLNVPTKYSTRESIRKKVPIESYKVQERSGQARKSLIPKISSGKERSQHSINTSGNKTFSVNLKSLSKARPQTIHGYQPPRGGVEPLRQIENKFGFNISQKSSGEACICPSSGITSKNTDVFRKGYGENQKPQVRSRSNTENAFGSGNALKYASQKSSAEPCHCSTSSKSRTPKSSTLIGTNQISNQESCECSTTAEASARGACDCSTGVPNAAPRRSTRRSCECSPSNKSKNTFLTDVSRKGYGGIQKPQVRSRSNTESVFGSGSALKYTSQKTSREPCNCSTSSKSRPPKSSTLLATNKISNLKSCECSTTASARTNRDPCECSTGIPVAASGRRPCKCSPSNKSKNAIITDVSRKGYGGNQIRSRSNTESEFGSESAVKYTSRRSSGEPCNCSTSSKSRTPKSSMRLGINQRSTQEPCECSITAEASARTNRGSCECSTRLPNAALRRSTISSCECSPSSKSKNTFMTDVSRKGYGGNQKPQVRSRSNTESEFGSESALKYTSQKSRGNPCNCSTSSKSRTRKSSTLLDTNQISNQESCECSTLASKNSTAVHKSKIQRSSRQTSECSPSIKSKILLTDAARKKFGYGAVQEPPVRRNSNLESTFGSDTAVKYNNRSRDSCECSISNKSRRSKSPRSTNQISTGSCECSPAVINAAIKSRNSLLSDNATNTSRFDCYQKSPVRSRNNLESTFGFNTALKYNNQKSNRESGEGFTSKMSRASRTSPHRDINQIRNRKPCKCSPVDSRSNLGSSFVSDVENQKSDGKISPCSSSKKRRTSKSPAPREINVTRSQETCECYSIASNKTKSNIESTFGSSHAYTPIGQAGIRKPPSAETIPSSRRSQRSKSASPSPSRNKPFLKHPHYRSNLESKFGSDTAVKEKKLSSTYKSGEPLQSKVVHRTSMLPQPLEPRRKSQLSRSNAGSTFGSDLGTCDCSQDIKSRKSQARSSSHTRDSCECAMSTNKSRKSMQSKVSSRTSLLPQPLQPRRKSQLSRSNAEGTFGSDLGSCECLQDNKSRNSQARSSSRTRESCECAISINKSGKSMQSKVSSRTSLLPQPLPPRRKSQLSRSNAEGTFGSDLGSCECLQDIKSRKSQAPSSSRTRDSCECTISINKSGKSMQSKVSSRTSLLPQPLPPRRKSQLSRSNAEGTFGSDLGSCECSQSIKIRKSPSPSRTQESCECSTSLKSKVSSKTSLLPQPVQPRRKSQLSRSNAGSTIGSCECSQSVKSRKSQSPSYSGTWKSCHCNSNANLKDKEAASTRGAKTKRDEGTVLSRPSPSSGQSPISIRSPVKDHDSQTSILRTHSKYDKKKNILPSLHTGRSHISINERSTSYSKNSSSDSRNYKSKIPRPTREGTIPESLEPRISKTEIQSTFGSSASRKEPCECSTGKNGRKISQSTPKDPRSKREPCECFVPCECGRTSSARTPCECGRTSSARTPCECGRTSPARTPCDCGNVLSQSRSNLENTFGSDVALASKKPAKTPCECGNALSQSRSRKPARTPCECGKVLSRSRSNLENTFGSDIGLTPSIRSNRSINSENKFGSDAHIKSHHRRKISGVTSPTASRRSSRASVRSRTRTRRPRSKTSISSHKTRISVEPAKPVSRKSSGRRSPKQRRADKKRHPSKTDLGAVLAGQAPRSGSTLIVSKNLQGSCTSEGATYPAAHKRSLTYVSETETCTPDKYCKGVAKGPKAAQLIHTPEGPVLYEKCYPGTCGKICPTTPCEVSYAHAVVSKFKNYTIYELTKQFRRRPWNMSKVTEGVFVVKCNK